jgi:hypothetical protein
VGELRQNCRSFPVPQAKSHDHRFHNRHGRRFLFTSSLLRVQANFSQDTRRQTYIASFRKPDPTITLVLSDGNRLCLSHL